MSCAPKGHSSLTALNEPAQKLALLSFSFSFSVLLVFQVVTYSVGDAPDIKLWVRPEGVSHIAIWPLAHGH